MSRILSEAVYQELVGGANPTSAPSSSQGDVPEDLRLEMVLMQEMAELIDAIHSGASSSTLNGLIFQIEAKIVELQGSAKDPAAQELLTLANHLVEAYQQGGLQAALNTWNDPSTGGTAVILDFLQKNQSEIVDILNNMPNLPPSLGGNPLSGGEVAVLGSLLLVFASLMGDQNAKYDSLYKSIFGQFNNILTGPMAQLILSEYAKDVGPPGEDSASYYEQLIEYLPGGGLNNSPIDGEPNYQSLISYLAKSSFVANPNPDDLFYAFSQLRTILAQFMQNS